MDKIEAFLVGNGDGNGNGYGYGYGDGNGNGNGNGNGYGDGYGYGYGDGNGNGYGDGYGDGNGNGDGYGYGYGDGNGDGYGYGYGDGNGNGYGNGYGYGYDFKILFYKGKPVYYVDGIPCVFVSVRGECAKVEVIDVMTFQATGQYICKFNGVFAHGATIKKAKEDAERKYYSTLDTEQSIELFKEKFKPKVKYPTSEFYQWHSILTGSCDIGKDMWMKQRGIKMDGQMTTSEFIELTKDSYGGEVIKQLSDVL
jgi:hypothetical protein